MMKINEMFLGSNLILTAKFSAVALDKNRRARWRWDKQAAFALYTDVLVSLNTHQRYTFPHALWGCLRTLCWVDWRVHWHNSSTIWDTGNDEECHIHYLLNDLTARQLHRADSLHSVLVLLCGFNFNFNSFPVVFVVKFLVIQLRFLCVNLGIHTWIEYTAHRYRSHLAFLVGLPCHLLSESVPTCCISMYATVRGQ